MKKHEKAAEKARARAAAGVTIKLPRNAYGNFKRLKPYIDAVNNNGGACKFYAGEYMPLTIEKLYYNGPFNHPVYSICHYGEMNGDMMRDPDITFEYVEEIGAIIPLSFRNDYMAYFREVFLYDETGKATTYNKKELSGEDSFLKTWTENIISQGFNPEVLESIA